MNMQNIQVGNICKFEDFEPCPGRSGCYKIGRVTLVTDSVIQYDVLLDIWSGDVWKGPKNECMQTPQPGQMFGDWPSRVQVLS